MSNDVSIFTNQNAVVHKGPRITALGQKLVDATRATGNRIQTNNKGTFKKLVNGEQVGDVIKGEFNCIIVGMLTDVSRIFYKEKYDPDGDPTMPNCWSNLGNKPEAGASDKQASSCAECPQNVAGSGDKGGKACRYQRRLAIMLEGDMEGHVYQINIPAKSLFGKGVGNVHPYESYIKFLVANRRYPDTVVTTISYDENEETMVLNFSPVRDLDDDEFALAQAATLKPETDMYTKLVVAQTDGVTVPPKKAEPKAEVIPAKIIRSEEPDEEDAVDIEEPAKRASKSEKEVNATSDELVSSVFEEWGDD
tara:strand:- start:546 stop:1469 length:924 start_codon:yes stop_codon:yes gene_type:complete